LFIVQPVFDARPNVAGEWPFPAEAVVFDAQTFFQRRRIWILQKGHEQAGANAESNQWLVSTVIVVVVVVVGGVDGDVVVVVGGGVVVGVMVML